MTNDQNPSDALQQGEIILTTLSEVGSEGIHNETPTGHKARLQQREDRGHEHDHEDSCRA